MVEYTVILAFGVLMLMGPGGDVLLDLATVMKNKYRGYSYAMSLSPLPDFGTGPRLANYIEDLNLDPELDDETLARLTVDPVQEQVNTALQPISDAYQAFNDINGLLGGMEDLDDIAYEMLRDAISPF
ncbi:MAG: hypothetical protein H6977_16125 [Gammaproteobacteria bacterium]|nr:hypothetical protein [Gammaproteobacteria bacterium]MCP5201531.1 hypothetical protein [Gammaproteobacteria bacterium]